MAKKESAHVVSADSSVFQELSHVVVHILLQRSVQGKSAAGDAGGDSQVFRFIQNIQIDSFNLVLMERTAAFPDKKRYRCRRKSKHDLTTQRQTFAPEH